MTSVTEADFISILRRKTGISNEGPKFGDFSHNVEGPLEWNRRYSSKNDELNRSAVSVNISPA